MAVVKKYTLEEIDAVLSQKTTNKRSPIKESYNKIASDRSLDLSGIIKQTSNSKNIKTLLQAASGCKEVIVNPC